MFHTIQFNIGLAVDVERSPKQPLERLCIHVGSRMRAQIKPYVVDSDYGPIEVADLFFEDGAATRMIPYACFSFVE
jgi:hypothetical protein